jgi:hypothetical protein
MRFSAATTRALRVYGLVNVPMSFSLAAAMLCDDPRGGGGV